MASQGAFLLQHSTEPKPLSFSTLTVCPDPNDAQAAHAGGSSALRAAMKQLEITRGVNQQLDAPIATEAPVRPRS
jgi:hypothetical protein